MEHPQSGLKVQVWYGMHADLLGVSPTFKSGTLKLTYWQDRWIIEIHYCAQGGGLGVSVSLQHPWFQWGMLTMLTIRPGKAEGRMQDQFPTLCPCLTRMRKCLKSDAMLWFLAGFEAAKLFSGRCVSSISALPVWLGSTQCREIFNGGCSPGTLLCVIILSCDHSRLSHKPACVTHRLECVAGLPLLDHFMRHLLLLWSPSRSVNHGRTRGKGRWWDPH